MKTIKCIIFVFSNQIIFNEPWKPGFASIAMLLFNKLFHTQFDTHKFSYKWEMRCDKLVYQTEISVPHKSKWTWLEGSTSVWTAKKKQQQKREKKEKRKEYQHMRKWSSRKVFLLLYTLFFSSSSSLFSLKWIYAMDSDATHISINVKPIEKRKKNIVELWILHNKKNNGFVRRKKLIVFLMELATENV